MLWNSICYLLLLSSLIFWFKVLNFPLRLSSSSFIFSNSCSFYWKSNINPLILSFLFCTLVSNYVILALICSLSLSMSLSLSANTAANLFSLCSSSDFLALRSLILSLYLLTCPSNRWIISSYRILSCASFLNTSLSCSITSWSFDWFWYIFFCLSICSVYSFFNSSNFLSYSSWYCLS